MCSLPSRLVLLRCLPFQLLAASFSWTRPKSLLHVASLSRRMTKCDTIEPIDGRHHGPGSTAFIRLAELSYPEKFFCVLTSTQKICRIVAPSECWPLECCPAGCLGRCLGMASRDRTPKIWVAVCYVVTPPHALLFPSLNILFQQTASPLVLWGNRAEPAQRHELDYGKPPAIIAKLPGAHQFESRLPPCLYLPLALYVIPYLDLGRPQGSSRSSSKRSPPRFCQCLESTLPSTRRSSWNVSVRSSGLTLGADTHSAGLWW